MEQKKPKILTRIRTGVRVVGEKALFLVMEILEYEECWPPGGHSHRVLLCLGIFLLAHEEWIVLGKFQGLILLVVVLLLVMPDSRGKKKD